MTVKIKYEIKSVLIQDQAWYKTDKYVWAIKAKDINANKQVMLVWWGEEQPPGIISGIYKIKINNVKDNDFGIQYRLNDLEMRLITKIKEAAPKEPIRQDDQFVSAKEDPITEIVKHEVPTSELSISNFVPGFNNSYQKAVENFKIYQYVMNEIMEDTDYAVIKGKRCLIKTGFKKLALAFNVADPEIMVEWLDPRTVQVTATAIAPNGRTSKDMAICSMDEIQGEKTRHNLLTKGITRAKNRAISNLVGCGLVSAEEMEGSV